jgi:diadenosine tetraphosphatase ApaH/serine/threonine PP2A family protein phosphatase
MDDRIWKEVDSADIPTLEGIMTSVDPGSQKWLRAQARLEKLRQERDAAETRRQHQASYQLGSRTLRWTPCETEHRLSEKLSEPVERLASRCRVSGGDDAGGLPLTTADSDCEFVHASLNRPKDWTYLVRREALQEHFKAQTRRLSFSGHTHVPCIWHFSSSGELSPLAGQERIELPMDGKTLINVGSVGQPRDLCPDACYAICDPQAGWVEFRRVHYDIAKTRRKISRAKLPAFAAQRLSLGK